MAEWYEQLLNAQLRVNRDLWAGLGEQGIEAGSELRLGFVYVAPGEPEATRLAAFLHEQTDYEIAARERPDAPSAQLPWALVGTTQAVAISLELLDEWVRWMIAAGADEGPCAFDGWAAQLLSA